MRARSRLIRLVLLAIVMATAVPLHAQEGRGVKQAAGVERVVARSRVVVSGTLFESTTFALPADEEDVTESESPRPAVQVKLSIVNFDEAILGRSTPGTSLDAGGERRRLAVILARKISDLDRLCELTGAQRAKLEIAGRGDVYRLFERIEDLRLRSQTIREHDREQNGTTLLLEWARGVSQEIQPLKVALASGPFGDGSLFAKTLTGMISPDEVAEYRRQQSAAASQPVTGVRPSEPLTIADRNARLAVVLAGWEKAASRIDRLDCQFSRFKYDRTFELEWRGTGALSIEKTGRAMYRIAPDPMKPGEVSKKLGAGGAPYAVKSDQPERWHWTGDRVIKINEKERTYEDWAEALSEFFFVPRLCFVGMTVRELNDRYHVDLKEETDTEVWLAFTPKHKKEQANLSNAVLILSKDQYRPRALKMLDPTGAETVHVFKDVQINRRGPVDDLERPSLHGYRRVLNEPAR